MTGRPELRLPFRFEEILTDRLRLRVMNDADIGLHRVIAAVDPRNAASVALCRRLGMHEEGCFVEDIWFKGAWADTGIFALRETEWRGRGDLSGPRPRGAPR